MRSPSVTPTLYSLFFLLQMTKYIFDNVSIYQATLEKLLTRQCPGKVSPAIKLVRFLKKWLPILFYIFTNRIWFDYVWGHQQVRPNHKFCHINVHLAEYQMDYYFLLMITFGLKIIKIVWLLISNSLTQLYYNPFYVFALFCKLYTETFHHK